MVVNFALMYSLGWSNWLRLIVWLAIGQAIYFGYGRRHSRLRQGGPPKNSSSDITSVMPGA
jgi:APA family basic amino acid/polyamine antiporter